MPYQNRFHVPVKPNQVSRDSTFCIEDIKSMVEDGWLQYAAACDLGPYVPKGRHTTSHDAVTESHGAVADRPTGRKNKLISSPLPLGATSSRKDGRSQRAPDGGAAPSSSTMPGSSTSQLRVGSSKGRETRAQEAAPYKKGHHSPRPTTQQGGGATGDAQRREYDQRHSTFIVLGKAAGFIEPCVGHGGKELKSGHTSEVFGKGANDKDDSSRA